MTSQFQTSLDFISIYHIRSRRGIYDSSTPTAQSFPPQSIQRPISLAAFIRTHCSSLKRRNHAENRRRQHGTLESTHHPRRDNTASVKRMRPSGRLSTSSVRLPKTYITGEPGEDEVLHPSASRAGASPSIQHLSTVHSKPMPCPPV